MSEDWKWYWPTLSRIDAEQLLVGRRPGTFLVRKSESSQSDFVLSLSSGSNIFHYRIKCSSKGLFLDAAEGVPQLYFSSCNELIEYYKKPDCGLPYVLGGYVTSAEALKHKDGSDSSDDEELAEISPFFKQQYAVISSGKCDDVVSKLLKEYVDKGVNTDWKKVKNGATEPPLLQHLLATAADDLHKSLDVYLKRLEAIKELFAFGTDDYQEKLDDESISISPDGATIGKSLAMGPEDLESILKKLNMCQTNIFKLEQKACKVLKETGGTAPSTSSDDHITPSSKVQIGYSSLPTPQIVTSSEGTVSRGEHMFEVLSGPLKNKSLYLLLRVKEGKFFICKSKTDDIQTAACYTCTQVVQLVKSKSYKSKLTVYLDNQASKQFTFENYKSRELFCQRIQQMKIAHSTDIPSSELSLFIGTWNMGDTPGPPDLSEWFKCQGAGKTKGNSFSLIPSDVMVIGTQESAHHEKEWVNRINAEVDELFNQVYHPITSCSLWGIRLVVLVKVGLVKLVNSVKQSTVTTGIANTLGNKGAVGVSFNIGTTSFCFINCHLTSGIEKLTRRNQNFHRILRGLELGQNTIFGIENSFHHLFWLGDLNYRIELEVTEIIKHIMENNWSALIASDQLTREMKLKNAFSNLEEEDLRFCPTYRYKRGARSMYIWTKEKITGDKINVPSWCDRVLWKSYPCLPSINTSYGCPQTIHTSDHSPVFASFDVGLLSETLSTLRSVDSEDGYLKNMRIIVMQGEGKIISNSNCAKFLLEFHSNCLETTFKSRVNSLENYEKKMDSLHQENHINSNHVFPWWVQGDLVQLVPIILDPNYLKDQHLLIAVKGYEDGESYGECVISLQPLLSGVEQTFELVLTHLGSETGTLKLLIHMVLPDEFSFMSSTKGKIYDLISIADEESACSNTTSLVSPSPPDVITGVTLISTPPSSDSSVGDAPQPKPRVKKKEKLVYFWLQSINLAHYFDLLIDNGYDDLDYYSILTADDLREIGIVNQQDAHQIVQNARSLPRKGLTHV